MKVLVIGGGISGEREVSLRSSKAVFSAIDSSKHDKEYYDWDGTEKWLKENASRFDVALPILHGVGGEDGQIQALLESLNLPYLGSDSAVSAVCISKEKTQAALAAVGVLVPAQAIVNSEEYASHPLADKPHVLKPIDGGSSLDTFVLLDGRLGDDKAGDVFTRNPRMILEEYIKGQEITVPVIDGYDLPVIGIVPPDVFFNFTNKYDGTTKEICEPDFISQEVQSQARALAKKCHDALHCRHVSRVDIIITEDNQLYVLEINTIPGLTDQSLVPKAAAHVGISMTELTEHFIQLACKQ